MSTQPTILTVESEQRPAFSLAGILGQQTWCVVSAPDFPTAIEAAREVKPKAVIVSSRVLGGGGVAVLRKLRSSVHTAAIPVIGVAGTKFEREALRAAGAAECVAEPIRPDQLHQALQKQIGLSQQVHEAPSEILADPERLAILERARMLDSSTDEMLDRLVHLASRLLHVPTVLVSIIDATGQTFKSQVGLSEPWATTRRTSLRHSFCQWVVSGEEDVVIDDATVHTVLRENLAIRDLGVVAYAGVPLYAATEQTLGSLCAIDSKPRPWSSDELAILRELRVIVDAHLAVTATEDSAIQASTARLAIAAAARLLVREDLAISEADRADLVAVIDAVSCRLVTAAQPAGENRERDFTIVTAKTSR